MAKQLGSIMQPSLQEVQQPWWARILEKQGIATVFALLMLGGIWRLADAHLEYLSLQSAQMQQQTLVLKQIVESNLRQESKLDTLSSTLQSRVQASEIEHELILKSLKK